MGVGGVPKEISNDKGRSSRHKSGPVSSAAGLDKLARNVSSFGKLSTRPADNTLFCRYEMKYRISESQAEALEQFIRPYIHLDRYSKLQPDSAYPIVSLYLDSEDLKLCRESLTGKKNRFKLRIRSYNDDPETPYFIEIKRRMNNVIIKSRVRVTHDNIASLFSGRHLPPQKYKVDEQALRQFQLYMHYINARPMIQVRYKRRAYEDDSDNRVRVTFDRWLCYNPASKPVVMFNGTGWQPHQRRGVILEIKFTARYPAWLSRMIKCFDLRAQSVSKYAASIKDSCLKGFCAPRLLV